MKNALLIVLSCVGLTISAYGQRSINIGFGVSFLGTGDVPTVSLENELRVPFNHYVKGGLNLSLGKGSTRIAESNYLQAGLNAYVYPFRSDRAIAWYLGGGLSRINTTHTYQTNLSGQGDATYRQLLNKEWGYQLAVGAESDLSDIYTLGTKFFTQRYTHNVNSGILFVVGVKL